MRDQNVLPRLAIILGRIVCCVTTILKGFVNAGCRCETHGRKAALKVCASGIHRLNRYKPGHKIDAFLELKSIAELGENVEARCLRRAKTETILDLIRYAIHFASSFFCFSVNAL